MKCAECDDKVCYQELVDCAGIRDEMLEQYQKPEILAITRTATSLEGQHYMEMTRIAEVMEFARIMGYQRLGFAFCVGLSEEARMLNDLLKERFEVFSVCCKVCGIEKEALGLEKIDKGREEAMCNPIAQAELLNRSRTELNLIVGLCVGHDILFSRYSKAPVTTLVVKDRVLAHNPLGALYSRYHRKKLAALTR